MRIDTNGDITFSRKLTKEEEEGIMLAGNTYDEIEDIAKHSRCVDEVLNKGVCV